MPYLVLLSLGHLGLNVLDLIHCGRHLCDVFSSPGFLERFLQTAIGCNARLSDVLEICLDGDFQFSVDIDIEASKVGLWWGNQ